MYKIIDIIRLHAITHSAVIATGVITNAFVLISVLSAFPWVRKLVPLAADTPGPDRDGTDAP